MSHCDARVPVEVKNFLSQKIFQLFFKTCLLHVSGLWDNSKRKKIFRLPDRFESRYRNEIRKAGTPPYLQSEKADSPCSDHMERGLELGCLIAMRECQSRSKIF